MHMLVPENPAALTIQIHCKLATLSQPTLAELKIYSKNKGFYNFQLFFFSPSSGSSFFRFYTPGVFINT